MLRNTTQNTNLQAIIRILQQHFFTSEEINFLLENSGGYSLSTINATTLEKYFSKHTVRNILHGNTRFFDLNKQEFDGCFELHFSDKLMSILNSRYPKKTNFSIPDPVTIGEYNISFMTDEEYHDGLALCTGEICGDCGSLGKPGGIYAAVDVLSKSSRSILIRKNQSLIGSSMIYLNDRNNTLVISSLNCLSNQNTAIIRLLIETMSLELLRKNYNIEQVAIGIGGSSFRHMNGVKFERSASDQQSNEYIALGKIRHATDLASLTSEVEICESAIGYPISRFTNRLSTEMEQLGFSCDSFKDCIHVASIIQQNNLQARADVIYHLTNSITQNIISNREAAFFKKFSLFIMNETPRIYLQAILNKAVDNYIKMQTIEHVTLKNKDISSPYFIYVLGFMMWGSRVELTAQLQALCAETINETGFAEVVATPCHERSTSSSGHIAQSNHPEENPIMLYMKLRFFPMTQEKAKSKFSEHFARGRECHLKGVNSGFYN